MFIKKSYVFSCGFFYGEKMNSKNITVLCKVVDNFGDIGVAWRLCKSINKEQLKINNILMVRLIVDDLGAFNKIDDRVKVGVAFQVVEGIEIYDWNDDEFCHSVFFENDGEKLSVILELFQCGRPQWMEKILFDEKLNRTVQIIMIDYLTAEKYAEDFHCLQSLTRSAKVQKVNFMPGFTNKTGGLIIDDAWKTIENYNINGPVLVFTYERNWQPLVKGIAESAEKNNIVMVAEGRGKKSFVEAWKNSGVIDSCILKELIYMNQKEWDEMMKKCSVLFIRGEESLSRACLSGIPFVWHAYPQSEEYQLVKMQALLDRMERHFSAKNFEIIKNVWLDFNLPEQSVDSNKMKVDVCSFINSKELLHQGFKNFAESLLENGDLSKNLMDYIHQLP